MSFPKVYEMINNNNNNKDTLKAIYLRHENIPCFIFLPRLLISCKIYSEERNAAPYRQGEPSVYKVFLQIKSMLSKKMENSNQL